MPKLRASVIVTEESAEAAYRAFVANNAAPVPWTELSDRTKAVWLRVVRAAASHISLEGRE